MTTAREIVLNNLNDAVASLTAAYAAGVEANAMAVDIPAFKEMLVLQKKVGEVMQAVGKLRGL